MNKFIVMMMVASITLAVPTLISESFTGNDFKDADGWATV
jgi:hypothetical protein